MWRKQVKKTVHSTNLKCGQIFPPFLMSKQILLNLDQVHHQSSTPVDAYSTIFVDLDGGNDHCPKSQTAQKAIVRIALHKSIS